MLKKEHLTKIDMKQQELNEISNDLVLLTMKHEE